METGNKEKYTYEAVTEAILAIPKFTKEKHDFSVLREYLTALGNPEKGFRVIHVAGTNGKGSVCRMLSGILQQAGRRVGSFYSPHLIRMNERIRVNGTEIPDDALVEDYLMLEEARISGRLPQLTFFEVLFVIALLYFRQAGAEDIVLETGLGGRLDATTSIPADLYVITEIGMDHEEYLGDTIEKIAAEKAGILTGDSPVIYHTGNPGADRVIEEKAEEAGCRAVINCARSTVCNAELTPFGIDFSFQNDYDRYNHVRIPAEALYQAENAVTAVTAAGFLFPKLPKERLQEVIRTALADFSWEGRLEEVSPGLYVDGAHNPPAAHRLVESVKALSRSGQWKQRTLIFGASGDKDLLEVMEELLTFPWDSVCLTRYRGSRAASVERLMKILMDSMAGEGRDLPVLQTAETLEDALKMTKNPDGFTLVTGSLYLVGELKELMKERGSV